jgi:hypothetical protein
VEIFDAHSGILVKTIGIESDGRITTIAIVRNGKGVAVAMEHGALNVSTPDADMATLDDARQNVGSNVDIVQTRAVSGVSLAYDPRGRYLFLVGNLTSRGKHGEYKRIGFCWDVINRREQVIFPEDESRIISGWTTPLYNMPCNNFAVFRGFTSNAGYYLEIYTSIQLCGNIICSDNYSVCSFNNYSVLILGNEDQFHFWDGSRDSWIPILKNTRPNSSDKTVYKELLRYEGKALENYGEQADVDVVAKIVWDNMPPLTEIKGFAETDAGLTLILEGEKFIFFGKEQTSG